jgi:peptidoglycan/LPS O-acetylase OafA/YrhL
LVVLLATFIIRNPEFRETFRYSLQGLALMPLFISAIRLHDHWAFKWLNSAPLQFMGVLSYTLYLVHYPILNLFEKWSDNRLVVGISALALSVAVAYAMHLLVERPMANMRKRFGSRTAEVIENIRETNSGSDDQSPVVAPRLLNGRRGANAMVRCDEWKQQLETERGR